MKTTRIKDNYYMKSIPIILVTFSFFAWVISPMTFAHNNASSKHRSYLKDSGAETEPGKVITQFHRAIKLGKKKKARYFLYDNVVIFEGGKVEKSADEYANHHMLSDMKYAAKLHTEVLEHKVTIVGDMAYSFSRTKSIGQYKGGYINKEGMETMVLLKEEGKWKISHIHWSH